MPFIKVDLDKLKAFSRNLEDWRFKADQDRIKGINQCSPEDPADIHSYFDFNSEMTHRLGDLLDLKGSLDTRIVNVEAVNQTGVSPMDSSETGYYLPDGVADTTANVTAYNKHAIEAGREEALELMEATDPKNSGRSSKGRTVEQIMTEIAKHQDIPTYGASFFSLAPPETYLTLINRTGLTLDSNPKGRDNALSILSHTFAAATQHGKNGEALAEAYGNSIVKKDAAQTERAVALNMLLTRSQAAFDTSFLVKLGNTVENLDPRMMPDPITPYPFGEKYSKDPLYGVMTAMGRNPEAALHYLSPDGEIDSNGMWKPGDKSDARWQLLNNRKWDNQSRTAFSAAMAGASAERNSDDVDTESKAAWATSQAVNHAAEYWRKDDYNDTIKTNMGVVMGNSASEIYRIANNEGAGPLFDKNNIGTVLYDIMDNDTAITTVSTKVADYSVSQAPDKAPNDGWTSDVVKTKYSKAGAASGFLSEIVKTRMEDNKASDEKKEETLNTAVSVFMVAAGGSGSAILDAAEAGIQPITVKTLAGETGIDENTLRAKSSATTEQQLETLAYQELVERNLTGGVAPPANASYYEEGKLNYWTDAEGNFTLPDTIDANLSDAVHEWGHGTDSEVFNEVDRDVHTGVGIGGTAFSGDADGRGALNINKK